MNRTAFETACTQRGLHTNTAIAAAFGIDRTQVGRVRNGVSRPGRKFISGLLSAWPEVRFEHFFTPEPR